MTSPLQLSKKIEAIRCEFPDPRYPHPWALPQPDSPCLPQSSLGGRGVSLLRAKQPTWVFGLRSSCLLQEMNSSIIPRPASSPLSALLAVSPPSKSSSIQTPTLLLPLISLQPCLKLLSLAGGPHWFWSPGSPATHTFVHGKPGQWELLLTIPVFFSP